MYKEKQLRKLEKFIGFDTIKESLLMLSKNLMGNSFHFASAITCILVLTYSGILLY